MLQLIKRFWWVWMLLASGAPSAFAFSLLGPFPTGAADNFEVPVIGYQLTTAAGDIGVPKNIAQGYRFNTRTLYYSFDDNFGGFFGDIGESEVDKAMAIYNGLTNYSAFSPNLAEFPLNSTRVNFTAQALSLIDVKSYTLFLVLEQLGLAQAERWVWCLHDRRLLPVPNARCPQNEIYWVIQRNFDPVTYDYTTYVNGTLYTYEIIEACQGMNPLADAIEIPVDPEAQTFTSVSLGPPSFGGFFNGLTYDDIGGLRYLYGTNSPSAWHVEGTGTNTLFISTNQPPQLLFTSNLTAFADQSFTNNTATLQGLYPGLVVSSETSFFTNVTITNITSFFTNNPSDPVGTPPHLVFITNTSPGFVQRFIHTFGNVVTNLPIYSNSFVTVQTTQPVYPPNFPAGQFYNQTTLTTSKTNIFNGDIYVIPANQCGFQIVNTILTNVVATTNIIVPTTTAAGGQTFGQSIVTYSTNHVYAVDIFGCISNNVAKYQAIDRINFVRRDDLDPLTGLYITPITNTYTLVSLTNNTTVVFDTFQRIITRPDILFTASDLASPPSSTLFFDDATSRTFPHFDATHALAGLAGPGTMDNGTQIQFSFNEVGPISFNGGGFFIPTEGSGFLDFQWGSYDGTTNAPIVYPNTVSLIDLQNRLVMQITTGLLPNGNVGVAYPGQQLQVTGGTPPYTWSLAPNSPGLPNGLSLSPGGNISGTPTTAGVFDFVIQAGDANGRTTIRNLSIEIDP